MFDDLRPVSLDRDALNAQLQAHRVLVADIQDHKGRVQGVAEKCRGKPGAQEMVSAVSESASVTGLGTAMMLS